MTASLDPPRFERALRLQPGDSDKGFWTRIGVTFANSDGKGFSLKLDLLPVNGADIVM